MSKMSCFSEPFALRHGKRAEAMLKSAPIIPKEIELGKVSLIDMQNLLTAC